MEVQTGTTSNAILPDYNYQTNTLIGQNHSYSVIFRGNGEVIVNARIAVGNTTDKPLKEVNLRIPKVQATGIYVFQIFKEKTCVRYEQQDYIQPYVYKQPACAEYHDPDYYNDYSYYNAKYKKADYDYTNDTLTVKLATPIETNKSGAFFIYFRAMGYAKKNVYGAYDYTFETLQAEDTVRSLNIGLATDSDLFMKGVKGEVNYRFTDVSPSIAKLGTGGGEMGVASTALDSYLSQIGYGSINKTASNLSPLESYKVTGSYANSRAKLYGKEIAIGVIVFVVVVALLILSVIFIIKLLKRSNRNVEKKEETVAAKEKPAAVTSNGKMFAVIALIGFIDSLVMVIYTIITVVLGMFITNNVNYSYQSLVGIVLVIVSILIYILLIFAPGILVGVKKGAGWGIGTVVSTVLWLIFWVIIIFVVLFLFGNIGVRQFIDPLMKVY